jgi:hypothetical protein
VALPLSVSLYAPAVGGPGGVAVGMPRTWWPSMPAEMPGSGNSLRTAGQVQAARPRAPARYRPRGAPVAVVDPLHRVVTRLWRPRFGQRCLAADSIQTGLTLRLTKQSKAFAFINLLGVAAGKTCRPIVRRYGAGATPPHHHAPEEAVAASAPTPDMERARRRARGRLFWPPLLLVQPLELR